MTLGKAVPIAPRATSMLPVAAGIFLGSLVFDAIPMASAAVGRYAWAWALCGVAVMWLSSRLTGSERLGRMASIAVAGVWLHSLLEGAAAGAGGARSLGGGVLVALGLAVHLIPEGAALFTLSAEAGLSARKSLARCGLTWVLVIAGYVLGAQLSVVQSSSAPMGAAMGLAAGTFAYLAWALWQQRTPRMRFAGLGAVVGFVWVAAIHLA